MLTRCGQRMETAAGGAQLVPAGYMYKLIRPPMDYLEAPNVIDLYSVGECNLDVSSPNFCDYTKYRRQNGLSFFNNPEIMCQLAAELQIDLSPMTLLYYEIYQLECDFVEEYSLELHWVPARFDSELVIDVSLPKSKKLVGYDALQAANLSAPDCSMLSCSNLAKYFSVNHHCLFDTFQMARDAISTGVFHDTEHYPQRLIAVYTVD